MAAPSTQSPPLGYDEATMQFLQDSLKPTSVTLPTLANPYADYTQGVSIGDSLNNAVLSGLHAQQAQQSIAASQAAAQLAAAKNPYELALLQAKTDAIPLDKKYNATLQQAQIDEMESKSGKLRAQSQNYGNAGPSIAPFSFQSQAQPTTPAASSGDVTVPTFSPGSLSTPSFSLDSTSEATDDALTPLLGAVAPSTDTSLATTLPTSSDNISGLLDQLDKTDPSNVTLSDSPDQSSTVADTSYVLPSANTFTAKATGYHPVSSDSADYKMEGGNQDAQGNPIHTLDAFRRGEVPDVTVAVDRSSPLFGQSGFSPDLNAPVKFTDTGSAFKGTNGKRVDIARDTAAGANADENNGNLTFQINGDDAANGPLVAVHDADSASGATVYQGGQQISGSGVVVPKSQDELTAQRNAFNQWSAQANAALSQTNNPRQQQAIKAQIANTAQALRQSEQLYLAGQKRGTASVTPTGNPADALADIDGYQKTDIRSTGGKLGARYVSDAQAASEQRAQQIKDYADAQSLISKEAGGATPSEFLGATPNQDGSYTVTHAHTTEQGLDVPITRTLPAPSYNRLASLIRPTVLPAPATPTANAGSDTDAKIAALATDPEFGGRTDNVLPTGLTPMSLVLGSRVMSATPRPTYAPTPTPSVQSQLDQATASLPATDDPVLQQANTVLAAQPPPDTTAAQQAQIDAKVKKSYAYQRGQQVNAAQNEVQQKRDALSALLNPDATSGTSAPVGTVAPTPAIAAATTAYKQAQAKLLAARDFNNYSLGDNGAYQYNDPFGANAGINGQQATVNNKTFTLRTTP